MRGVKRLVLTLCGVLISPALWAQAEAVQFRLDNGLRVVVQADHRAPVVVAQVWYQVGSADEPPGLTGISHVLEHMMFKGTPTVPAGEFSRVVSHMGGDDNAFTTDNYTVYYQNHVADRLALALEMEADRMQHAIIDPKAFASELQVVMEERRLRTDDNPQALAYERFQLMAYPSSSQRNPTVGWMDDLQKLTAADVTDWYQRWYAPNNAILVVVGDVQPEQVKVLAQQYFGGISARDLPRRASSRELVTPGERRLTLTLPGQVPALFMGYNWPSLSSAIGAEDAYALRLLAGVLDEGVSARLERQVVRAGKAVMVRSGYDILSRGDTLFTITAVPSQGQSLADLETAILTPVRALREELVTQAEINRVQANVIAQSVFVRDEVDDQAQLLGRLASNDLPLKWADGYADHLKRITPEQLREVARRYLTDERLSVLHMHVKGAQP
jgi:zinc protease